MLPTRVKFIFWGGTSKEKKIVLFGSLVQFLGVHLPVFFPLLVLQMVILEKGKNRLVEQRVPVTGVVKRFVSARIKIQSFETNTIISALIISAEVAAVTKGSL